MWTGTGPGTGSSKKVGSDTELHFGVDGRNTPWPTMAAIFSESGKLETCKQSGKSQLFLKCSSVGISAGLGPAVSLCPYL